MTREPALDGHLLPDETIVWSGRPPRAPRFGLGGPFFVAVAILWCVGLLQSPEKMLGLYRWPIVAAVLLLATGRLLLKPWQLARTRYAVTDRRVLIVRSRPWPEVIALPLDRLPPVTLDEEGDGRGTIRFGRARGLLDLSGRMPRLVGLADARHVLGLLEAHAAHER